MDHQNSHYLANEKLQSHFCVSKHPYLRYLYCIVPELWLDVPRNISCC